MSAPPFPFKKVNGQIVQLTQDEIAAQQAAAAAAAGNALQQAQAAGAAQILAAKDAAVAAVYAQDTLTLLLALYSQANAQGLTNRAAYLAPLIAWGNSMAAAVEAAIGAVEVATDQASVNAAVASFLPPTPPNPLPTRAGAMQITN